MELDLTQLNTFIVKAKSASYVGAGAEIHPCRSGAHDLEFLLPPWRYHDSYFGGADFIGEEVVYFEGQPVWAMNYYGRILLPASISAAETGAMIRASLARMYAEGRFLGGFTHAEGQDVYTDASQGDAASFSGVEAITRLGIRVYELLYHGGLIK